LRAPRLSPVVVREWNRDYAAVLREGDRVNLFHLVEVAQASIKVRLDEVGKRAEHRAERKALTTALARLSVLKSDTLGFRAAGISRKCRKAAR